MKFLNKCSVCLFSFVVLMIVIVIVMYSHDSKLAVARDCAIQSASKDVSFGKCYKYHNSPWYAKVIQPYAWGFKR